MRIPVLPSVAIASCLAVLPATPAFAGAHTWDVHEVFSNADGTIQFIELREMNGGNFEVNVGGHEVTSNTNSFTIPSSVVGPTGFRHLLLATSGFAALPGAPTPDHILPTINFFSVDGDTITYVPYDTMIFGPGELPTDGVHSLNEGVGEAVNSPTNYAGQTGSINTNPPPPGVPDGTDGSTPMTVAPLDAGGTALSIAWDTATCTGADGTHIIFGEGTLLPGAPGDPFGLTGAICDIGSSSPFTWSGVPVATDGSGLLWWLVVSTDAAGTEGSWGKGSAGLERVGPGPGGSSGRCGAAARSLASTCGH